MKLPDELITAFFVFLFFNMALLVRYVMIWRTDMRNTKVRLLQMEKVVRSIINAKPFKLQTEEAVPPPRVLNSNKNNKDTAEAIRNYIEIYHPDFIDALSCYAESRLTSSDELLCMMIKLDYNSKEIATVFSITTNSVIKARYRLKKKLLLSSNQPVDKWIQSLGV